MEGVRLGRESNGQSLVVPLSTVSGLAIGESLTRMALVFPGPLAGNVTYSLQNPAVSGQGLVLNASSGPFSLDIQTHGDLVRRAWYAVADAGTPTVQIFFSDLPKE